MVWPSPALYAPGDAELDLTTLILTDGLASRLSKVLVYDRQLCTNVNAFQASAEMAGFYAVVATARPGASLPEIEKIITQEIARLAREGPTAAELARAKTKQEFTFVTGLERIGGFGGKADRLNSYATYPGKSGRVRVRPGPVPQRHGRRRSEDRGALARHEQSAADPLPSGKVGPAERVDGRPGADARPRSRSALPRAGSPHREALERHGDPRRRAPGPAESRRGAGRAGGRRRRPGGQVRHGLPDGPGRCRSARRRARRSRSSRRWATSERPSRRRRSAKRRASPWRCSSATSTRP